MKTISKLIEEADDFTDLGGDKKFLIQNYRRVK